MTDNQDYLTKAADFISQLPISEEDGEDERCIFEDKVNEIIGEGCVIQWNRLDEDDNKTWPEIGRTVLVLITWSHGPSHRYGSIFRPEESRERAFYEAHIGEYIQRVDNGEVYLRFMLDTCDDEDDDEGVIDPPRWWTYIATPQAVGLE